MRIANLTIEYEDSNSELWDDGGYAVLKMNGIEIWRSDLQYFDPWDRNDDLEVTVAIGLKKVLMGE